MLPTWQPLPNQRAILERCFGLWCLDWTDTLMHNTAEGKGLHEKHHTQHGKFVKLCDNPDLLSQTTSPPSVLFGLSTRPARWRCPWMHLPEYACLGGPLTLPFRSQNCHPKSVVFRADFGVILIQLVFIQSPTPNKNSVPVQQAGVQPQPIDTTKGVETPSDPLAFDPTHLFWPDPPRKWVSQLVQPSDGS